jgi:hypothetical protein
MSPRLEPKKDNKGVQEINLDELGLEVLSKTEISKIDFEEPTMEELKEEEKIVEEELDNSKVIGALKKDTSGASGLKDRDDDKRRA